MPINFKGGFEYAADVCKVYALVAHWWIEVAVCVCVPGTDGWRYKWPEVPLEDRNRS